MIPKESLISCGGSVTLYETGLDETLKNQGYNFLNLNNAQGAKSKDKIAHEALIANHFLMSSNAIADIDD